MRIGFMTLLSILIFVALADAQVVEVRPGSALVDTHRLVEREDSFAVTTSSGTAQMVLRTTVLGDTALLVVERIWAGNDATVDSFVVRRRTLEPLSFDRRNSREIHALSFSAGWVRGTITRGGLNEPVNTRVDPPAFFVNTTNLLFGSLPLREGAEYYARMWDAEAYEMRFRVAGREVVSTLEGGRCEAWRVEVGEAGDSPMTYWVEVGTQSLLAFRTEGFGFRIERHPECPPGG